jgi:hypothetical protein
MVKRYAILIIISFFVNSIFANAEKKKLINELLSLRVEILEDSVCMGDTLLLTLFINNESSVNIDLSINDKISVFHSSKKGILDNIGENFVKLLSNGLKEDIIVVPPGKAYKIITKMPITEDFFVIGENRIRISYDSFLLHSSNYRKKILPGYEIFGYLWSSNDLFFVATHRLAVSSTISMPMAFWHRWPMISIDI